VSTRDQGREEKRDTGTAPPAPAPLKLTTLEFDVVELAALRGQAPAVATLASCHGLELPQMGRVRVSGSRIALCVRPARWLILSPAESPGAATDRWQTGAAGIAAVIDLSCALSAYRLEGDPAAIRARLARGCRLDLRPEVFPAGYAAATLMAQVSVMLASLAEGMLLLTPSTTARHFHQWLEGQCLQVNAETR
jgi:heterotetrameric sarcosine oxidase gamma subunit